jgi:hypothetical protein
VFSAGLKVGEPNGQEGGGSSYKTLVQRLLRSKMFRVAAVEQSKKPIEFPTIFSAFFSKNRQVDTTCRFLARLHRAPSIKVYFQTNEWAREYSSTRRVHLKNLLKFIEL